MIGKLQCKEYATPKFQHLGRLGKNADHRCSICASDFVDEASRDHARHHLIEHHDELTDLELPGDFHGNGCSLKVLSIGPKQDHEDIGDSNAEKRFFVQPRMGVDAQIVEHELVDQILETVVHEAHVVAFTQHLGDLCGIEAGGDEPDASPGLLDPFGCHVHGRLSNAAPL